MAEMDDAEYERGIMEGLRLAAAEVRGFEGSVMCCNSFESAVKYIESLITTRERAVDKNRHLLDEAP